MDTKQLTWHQARDILPEGWADELRDKGGTITRDGVVYTVLPFERKTWMEVAEEFVPELWSFIGMTFLSMPILAGYLLAAGAVSIAVVWTFLSILAALL